MRFLPPGYRHYAVCLIAAAAALPAFAQHGEDRPDPQALFNALDTDGSATLSRDELSRLPNVMAARHAARIDTNNDGCTFPIGGHNHTYAIAIGGDDGAIQASGAAALTPQATESSLSRKPFPFGRVLMLSSFAAAAVLLIVSSFQGDSE